MIANLHTLPIGEKIQLVEDLWDSIAADQASLPLTAEQRAELDKRLDSYELDGIEGRVASEVISDIRKRL
jgi:putative addiction module component (TIGR02574 family)